MAQDREEIRRNFNEAMSSGQTKVEIIEADERYQQDIRNRQERVGVYCRVSTMSGEQVESFEAQKKSYEDLIETRPNWNLVDIYADEGISATSIKRRKNFQRLVQDCNEGKVSLVVTKTVTRFARNVIDCIKTCRDLKGLNPSVGVLFEADNIFTLDDKSEIHLAMMAILAQSESETKSTSIRWALRNRWANGVPTFVKVYGYSLKRKYELQPGEKRTLIINEEQAEVVRFIYQQFMGGASASHIASILKQRGIPSPKGNEDWSYSTIMYILTNETYAGFLIRQKSLTTDVFSHKSVKNRRFIDSYKIEGTHEPIIPLDVWLEAQERVGTRSWEDYLLKSVQVTKKGQVFYPIMLGESGESSFQ